MHEVSDTDVFYLQRPIIPRNSKDGTIQKFNAQDGRKHACFFISGSLAIASSCGASKSKTNHTSPWHSASIAWIQYCISQDSNTHTPLLSATSHHPPEAAKMAQSRKSMEMLAWNMPFSSSQAQRPKLHPAEPVHQKPIAPVLDICTVHQTPMLLYYLQRSSIPLNSKDGTMQNIVFFRHFWWERWSCILRRQWCIKFTVDSRQSYLKYMELTTPNRHKHANHGQLPHECQTQSPQTWQPCTIATRMPNTIATNMATVHNRHTHANHVQSPQTYQYTYFGGFPLNVINRNAVTMPR